MEQDTHNNTPAPSKASAVLQANAIPIAIIIAGLLIGSAVVLNSRYSGSGTGNENIAPAAQNGAQPTAPAKAANIDEIKIAGNPFLGKPNAPVVVAYWFDYQCPFCKKVEGDVFPQLVSEYVNTGKVKIVFKGFPVLGNDSYSAALAERGIWELAPDKFYEWHKQMFVKQDAENAGWGNRKDIVALATALGINGDQLDALVVKNAAAYQKSQQADLDEGQAYGVTGTPSFMIGKKLIIGSVPYAQIKAAVEEVLKSK